MLDFAIVGWPKCGTSSLYQWLNDHPEMEGSNPKETFYLMDEDHPLINKKNNWHKYKEKGLQSYFSGKTNTIKFEATTHYYYQETTLQYFTEVNQKAKVIFITRNPTRRILSSFNYTKENLGLIKEAFTFDDYVKALLTDNKELMDDYYLSDSSLYIAKKELKLSNYDYWLRKWEEAIGRDRMLVLTFEELKNNPVQLLEKMGEAVGFDAFFYRDYVFSKKNKSQSIANYRLHRFMRSLNSTLPSFMKLGLLKKLYFNLQRVTTSGKQEEHYKQGLQQLQKYFN